MTMMTYPVFEDMKLAKNDLRAVLMEQFTVAGRNDLVGDVGMSLNTAQGRAVEVKLQRVPTETEALCLPENHLGVPVQYQVSRQVN